ncbi:PIN domain-containing protein [bacterium]|nr:PIN domain-containing protein [bacterium]
MKVLVDTPVWSLAFRRKTKDTSELEKSVVSKFNTLIEDYRVVLIGPIRQEILSGISNIKQYNKLKESLRAFVDFPIKLDDYEHAARLFNKCRAKGVQGSHIDFLICAVAINNGLTIFTLDVDFKRYAEITSVRLL